MRCVRTDIKKTFVTRNKAEILKAEVEKQANKEEHE